MIYRYFLVSFAYRYVIFHEEPPRRTMQKTKTAYHDESSGMLEVEQLCKDTSRVVLRCDGRHDNAMEREYSTGKCTERQLCVDVKQAEQVPRPTACMATWSV